MLLKWLLAVVANRTTSFREGLLSLQKWRKKIVSIGREGGLHWAFVIYWTHSPMLSTSRRIKQTQQQTGLALGRVKQIHDTGAKKRVVGSREWSYVYHIASFRPSVPAWCTQYGSGLCLVDNIQESATAQVDFYAWSLGDCHLVFCLKQKKICIWLILMMDQKLGSTYTVRRQLLLGCAYVYKHSSCLVTISVV